MSSKLHALVIDDDDGDRLLVARALRTDRDFTLHGAASLDEGIAITRTESVDVILLDLGLVETNGLETLVQLGSQVENIPIVVLTGMSNDDLSLQAIELGAQDYIQKAHLSDRWISRCLRYAIQRHQLQVQLKEQTLTDGLTSLKNRKYFESELTERFQQSQSRGFAVGFIDLDDFKLVNDCFGHEAGDSVLCEFASRLRTVVGRNDITARFGGDEFVVLLDGVRSDQELDAFSRDLAATLVEPMRFDGREYHLAASIGYAIRNANYRDPRDMLRDADTAMYRAKRDGASLGKTFCESMRDDAFETVEMQSQLHQALAREEFELVYQPIVDLRSGAITNFEALLRWTHPELGTIPPLKFVPHAERAGLIVPIGRWILETACQTLARWHALTDNDGLRMSVNISTVQIASGHLLDDVQAALHSAPMAAERLDLEITESSIMEDPVFAIEVLETLRTLGVGISIDDFGTGYSSLAQLHRIRFDTIKIDREFVQEMLADRHADMLVQTILMLARSMGVAVIAEGIERDAEVQRLCELGCVSGQGYLLGPPISEPEVIELLCREEAVL